MILLLAAAVQLIVVHMVDGRSVEIAPAQITQMVHLREKGHRQVSDKVMCLIRFTGGDFLSVAETCEEVQRLIEGTKQ